MRRPQISFLIPFRSDQRSPERIVLWDWLQRYWSYEMPDAEIVIGRCRGKVFSKTAAVNDAARRAHGRLFAIADADLYMRASVLHRVALEIEEAARRDQRLWFVPYRHLYRLTSGATDLVLASDPRNPLRFHTPPQSADVVRIAGSGFGHRFGAMIQVMPREAFFAVGGMDRRFCVDTETEILTTDGWKNYRTAVPGATALTLNHETGMSEWQPIQAINVFPAQPGQMLSMESKNHSSLTTLNHRWPVVRRPDYRPGSGWGSRLRRRAWATSATLTSEDRIPVAAECADLPSEPKYSDDLVELIAWFWTEGHIVITPDGNPGRTVSISQSLTANPDHCDRIQATLTRCFGPGKDRFVPRGKSPVPHEPQWRDVTHPSKPECMMISLNAEAGDIVQASAPGRVPSHAFLLSLTRSQLSLFIEVSLLADGCTPRELAQKDAAAAEAFQFACTLAGYATSVRSRMSAAYEARYGYRMTHITQRTAQMFGPHKGQRQIVDYDGVVWCPTTPNGTWLARRHGTTWFTGNSGWGGEDVAFVHAVDTLWAPHHTTDNEIFHLWHPSLGALYTTRTWEGQDGPRANDRLSSRYGAAWGDPARMRTLVAEATARRWWHRKPLTSPPAPWHTA